MADPAAATKKQDEPHGSAQSYYTKETSTRDPFLVRARRLAGITMPALFREQNAGGSTQEELAWNSIGAYLVSSFSSALVFSMFPPGRAPIKLTQDHQSATELANDPELDDATKANMAAAIILGLSKVESEFSDAMEQDGDRAKLTMGAARMVVGGQHGFQFYTDGSLRGIPLDRHVTRRDPTGTLISFGVLDPLSYMTLPAAVRTTVDEAGYLADQNKNASGDPVINVYTYGYLEEDGMWTTFEEVWGLEVKDTRRRWSKDDLPYFFPPFMLLENEDYGRSYCEWYEADLQSVEGLTQTIIEGSAAMARFLMLLRPGSQASKQQVAEAPNGAVLTGAEGDITVPVFGKAGDYQVAASEKGEIIDRLTKAFLVFVQRNAERVTAEEIKTVANELDKAQAGVYSQAVVTFQLPYSRLKLNVLQRTKRVTQLPGKSVKMTLLGGLAALGRTAEAMALSQAFQAVQGMFGPQVMLQALGPNAIRTAISRVFAAFGVDPTGLLPSPEEAKQIDQTNQMQQMMANPAAVEALKQVGNNLTANQTTDTKAGAQVEAASVKALPPPPAEDGTQGAPPQ